MFATIAMQWRTSWFSSLEEAVRHAEEMLGVDAVEEIGVGIVWEKVREPEYLQLCEQLDNASAAVRALEAL